MKQDPSGKPPSCSGIAEYLKRKIKWADPRNVPSAHVVGALLSISRHVMKNTRVMQTIQKADALWGREHIFDEYSKLKVIVGRASNPEELAYMIEGLFVAMRRNTLQNAFPDKASLADLKAHHSQLHM